MLDKIFKTIYSSASKWPMFFLRYILNNIYIYQTPPLGQDMTQGQFLSGV